MRVYVATIAHGFSAEEAVCIARTEGSAAFALTDIYPRMKRLTPSIKDPRVGYDPNTGNKEDQAYVREYNVLGIDPKKAPDKIEHTKDGRVVLYLITTAYINQTGLESESPWGVAVCVDDALREIRRFFPDAKKINNGFYIETRQISNDNVSGVAIRITKTHLED